MWPARPANPGRYGPAPSIPVGWPRRAAKEDRHFPPGPFRVAVVDSAATGAEPDDAEIVAVLGLQTHEMDDEAMAALDRELIRLALSNPQKLARVAAENLSGTDALRRVAAAFALGRAAEAAEPDLVALIEATLVREGAVAHDDLRYAIATALLHVWGRNDDETSAAERRYATDPSPTLRLAAAMSLALSTPEPLPSFLVPMVRKLRVDAEPAVQSWAEHALSCVQE
jgi:hypothetical protein